VIGIDTNILVRFLTKDDTEQFLRARKLMRSLTPEEPGFIGLAVLVELVWVMQRVYGKTKDETTLFLENLLHTEEMVVENASVVWQSLNAYARSNADFADCVIERSAHHALCTHTVTLDERAAKTAGMVLLDL
jgi:predicted nucleic-acid-binding protein